MLLNVGPRADGTITEEETAVLEDLGRWLKINGEAIYDTVPWKWFGEGSVNAEEGFFMDGDEKSFTPEDFRFTYRGGKLYAIQLRPDGKDVCIRTLAEKGMYDFGIDTVSILGCAETVCFSREKDGLHIQLPENTQTDFPLTFKIQLK